MNTPHFLMLSQPDLARVGGRSLGSPDAGVSNAIACAVERRAAKPRNSPNSASLNSIVACRRSAMTASPMLGQT